MSLGHTDRQLVETTSRVQRDLLFRLKRVLYAESSVHLAHDGFDFFLDAHLERVKEPETTGPFAGADDGLGERGCAGAPLRSMIAHLGLFGARRDGEAP